MAVTPETLLEAAEEISAGDREVDWRNAASRGYYAAYHRCVLLVYRDPSAQPGHRQLIDQLTDPKAAVKWRQAGHVLRNCKILREKADYATTGNFEQGEAETAIDAGRRIFEFADSG